MQPVGDVAEYLAGFTAAEGCFTGSGDRFRFAVGLGASDASMCELLHDFFEVGAVRKHRRRKPHYDDEVVFAVQSLPDLIDIIVPFMDEYLPPSYKRAQYLSWRERLFDYWEHRARRRRACTVEACDLPRRAKSLCRRHYFEAFGS